MILKGDCIEVMKAMKSNSMDAICTDPPYGLEFMGKEWDKLWDKREFGIDEYSKKSYTCSDGSTRKTNPVSRKLSNPNYKAGIEAQLWHTQWLTEAYRVLKPGGSMLVMGGTRTSHRLACAIEDTGFIIKDTLMWLYGSGFPKAQDLGKMIDKRAGNEREIVGEIIRLGDKKAYSHNATSQIYGKDNDHLRDGMRPPISIPSTDLAKYWDGFKVGGIKPAYEPIIWAVKPPEGSYVDNILKWGVGAVNVDECRIGLNQYDKEDYIPNRCGHKDGINHIDKLANKHNSPVDSFGAKGFDKPHWNQKGRFPANIILSHHPECVQVGAKKVRGAWSNKGIVKNKSIFNANLGQNIPVNKDKYYDPDGYETVESWDCHPDCAVRLLDEQSGELKSGQLLPHHKRFAGNKNCYGKATDVSCTYPQGGDSGGASRFFKQCNYGQEEWLCHGACALRQLDEQSGVLKSGARKGGDDFKLGRYKDQKGHWGIKKGGTCEANSGGASRFFYCAKASRGERNAGLEGMEEKQIKRLSGGKFEHNSGSLNSDKNGGNSKNNHPTVKPIKLFEWLIKLVTREGQIVLDPFIGSGTTIIAAHNAGRKCVGIEKEEEYIEIAKRRATHWRSRPRQLEII